MAVSGNLSTNHSSSVRPQFTMQPREWLLVMAFLLIMCFGVTGNLLVCYVFGYKKKRRRRSTTEWLILYLGVIDLLTSLFNPPLYIYWTIQNYSKWHFGYYGCKLIPALGPIMTSASAGILLIFAIDRFFAIVSPFNGKLSLPIIHGAVVINLILSALAYVHYIVALTFLPQYKICYIPKVASKEYGVTNCILIIFRLTVFAAIFITTNVSIFVTLRRNERRSSVRNVRFERHRQSLRIMRVLLTMGIVFIVLVFPRELFYLIYNLSQIISVRRLKVTQNALEINSWLKVMHTANSCANVFIYAHMQNMYRKQLLKLVHLLGCCKTLLRSDYLGYSTHTATSPMLMSRQDSFPHHNSIRKTNSKTLRNDNKGRDEKNIIGNSWLPTAHTMSTNGKTFFTRAQRWKGTSDAQPPIYL